LPSLGVHHRQTKIRPVDGRGLGEQASPHGKQGAAEWTDEYNPNTFDELPIKYALSRIANRRNAAKARIAKNK